MKLRRHCRALLDFPNAAPLRPELGDAVRIAVHDQYLILYAVQGDVLVVRRALHGARYRETL